MFSGDASTSDCIWPLNCHFGHRLQQGELSAWPRHMLDGMWLACRWLSEKNMAPNPIAFTVVGPQACDVFGHCGKRVASKRASKVHLCSPSSTRRSLRVAPTYVGCYVVSIEINFKIGKDTHPYRVVARMSSDMKVFGHCGQSVRVTSCLRRPTLVALLNKVSYPRGPGICHMVCG